MLESVLGTNEAIQIGMVVPDVEKAKRDWAAFLGVEVPPTVDAGDYAVTKTVYMGKPAPEASCQMAFFNVKPIQIELIEPNAAPSTWRDQLEKCGGSIHHYGYSVKNIYEAIGKMEAIGFRMTQFGFYGSGNGAYAYFDCTEKLGCYIELLTDF